VLPDTNCYSFTDPRGSRTSASLKWQHWHQRCISGLCESGGIPHLFRTQ